MFTDFSQTEKTYNLPLVPMEMGSNPTRAKTLNMTSMGR